MSSCRATNANVDDLRKRNAILLALYHRCHTATTQNALMHLAPAGATAEDLRELCVIAELLSDSDHKTMPALGHDVLLEEIRAVLKKLEERK